MTYVTYWFYILFNYLEPMNTVIDYKYITLLGPYLTGFKSIGNNLWNFRCPLCGDSEKKQTKKRGYIYNKEGTYRFHCHNCGRDMSLKNFLYNVSPELYKDYREETLFGKLVHTDQQVEQLCKQQSKHITINKEKYLTNITELQNDHPAVMYVRDVRRIPKVRWNQVYFTEHYQELINEHFGDKYKNSNLPSTGIVFVVRSFASEISGVDNDYPVIGYQLRSIDPNCPKAKRFITCIEPQKTGVFGIDKLDWNKQIFIVEGPIDSLFIPNCIAVFNSALYRVEIPNAIYVNDCEPRNKEIVKQIDRCISKGNRVALLPEKYFSLDINDIVCKYNLSESELIELLETNSYQGLEAKLKFSKWRLW